MLSVVVIEADGLEAKDVNGKFSQFCIPLRLFFMLQTIKNTGSPAELSFQAANK